MILEETVVLPDALVSMALDEHGGYRIAYAELVVYENGRRRVRGRSSPYEIRSIEQLRYDFERDVETVGGRLG